MEEHLISAPTSSSLRQVSFHRDTSCAVGPWGGNISCINSPAVGWPTPVAVSPVGLRVRLQWAGASAFALECIDLVLEERRSTRAKPTGLAYASERVFPRPNPLTAGTSPAHRRQVSAPTPEAFRPSTLVYHGPLRGLGAAFSQV